MEHFVRKKNHVVPVHVTEYETVSFVPVVQQETLWMIKHLFFN